MRTLVKFVLSPESTEMELVVTSSTGRDPSASTSL